MATTDHFDSEKKMMGAVSTVLNSQYRLDVFTELTAGPGTPSDLSDRVDREVAHVSRALQELREEDLVELLVPEEMSKGRIYGLTESGKAIADRVMEMSQ